MSKKEKVKQNKSKGHAVRYVLSAILAVICIVGVGYLYTILNYHTEFSKGTTINGIDVSGLTVKAAEEKVKAEQSDYAITLKFRENQSETLDGTDIDFSYLNDFNVQGLLDNQNNRKILDSILGRPSQYVLQSNFSNAKLMTYLKNISEMKEENMVAPVDAHPVYENHTFSIEAETLGTTLDTDEVYKAVKEAIQNSETTLDLEELYKNPSIYADDATLAKQISKLNKLAATSVTYLLPDGKKQVLDGSTLINWLVKSKKGTYKKDQAVWNEKLTEYVHEMADAVDTTYKPHTFHTSQGTDITLPALGYYGWKIDEASEIAQLTKDLESNETIEREPVYSKREGADSSNNNGFGTTYCEINLSKQHLWIYQNGKVVLETDVVSGKNDSKHKTPAGAFTAYDKQRHKIMRGERQQDGQYEYETEANYWIRLTNSGVGLHDAPWRAKFGGDIWKKNGSHGCVNLPASMAPKIYNYIENGTPVAVYY